MRNQNRWGRRTWAVSLIVAVLATLSGSSALADSKKVNVENVRVGFQDRFKVGTWTPVWVQLRGGLEGFEGLMQIVTPDPDGMRTVMSQQIKLLPGATQRFTTYARPGSLDPDFATLQFIDGKTGRSAIPDIVIGNITGTKPPESLSEDDYQVLGLGNPSGIEGIAKLPGFNADRATAAMANNRAREVVVANLSTRSDLLPGYWYGFDAVDVVVVDTNDKEMLEMISGSSEVATWSWESRRTGRPSTTASATCFRSNSSGRLRQRRSNRSKSSPKGVISSPSRMKRRRWRNSRRSNPEAAA
jgi:hypothetical protein